MDMSAVDARFHILGGVEEDKKKLSVWSHLSSNSKTELLFWKQKALSKVHKNGPQIMIYTEYHVRKRIVFCKHCIIPLFVGEFCSFVIFLPVLLSWSWWECFGLWKPYRIMSSIIFFVQALLLKLQLQGPLGVTCIRETTSQALSARELFKRCSLVCIAIITMN